MSTLLDTVVTDHIAENWQEEPAAEKADRLGAYLLDLRERYKNLTPAEGHARMETNRLIVETEAQQAQAKLATKYQVPILSLEPLRWRQKKHLAAFIDIHVPKLALCFLQADRVKIAARFYRRKDGAGHWRTETIDDRAQTMYPTPIMACYEPIRKSMEAVQPNREHLTISWQFKHVIPAPAKQTITEIAPSGDFEAMFLLAETSPDEWEPSWSKYQDEPRLPRFDPLIVGWAADALWLLDRFDATPLEEYVASEFALPAPVSRQLESGTN